jgi:hypothetical protein
MATLNPRVVGCCECPVLMSIIEQADLLHVKVGRFADGGYPKAL